MADEEKIKFVATLQVYDYVKTAGLMMKLLEAGYCLKAGSTDTEINIYSND